jgi:hypothetical protein
VKTYDSLSKKWKQNEPHSPGEEYLFDLILDLYDEIDNLKKELNNETKKDSYN